MGMNAHVNVVWDGEGLAFTGHNENGVSLAIDGDKLKGSSPMVLLLHAEAGCTGIDVLSILQKMQQPPSSLRIEVDAVKRDDDYPKVWEKIHLRYIIGGPVTRDKAEQAIKLSLEKYCSVSAMLHHTAAITHELVLEG
jgi:putative redox protein